MARLLHRSLAQAFLGWREHTTWRIVKRVALAESMKRITSGALGRAFAAWKSHVVRLADLKTRSRICAARLANAAAARAFSSWRAWALQKGQMRYLPLKGLNMHGRLPLLFLFNHLGSSQAMIYKHIPDICREVGKAAVMRLLHRTLAQALFSWREHTSWRAVKKAALADSMRRITNGALGRAFAAWKSQATRLADLKTRSYACVVRLANAAVTRAFGSWRDWALQKARLRYGSSVHEKDVWHVKNHRRVSVLIASWHVRAYMMHICREIGRTSLMHLLHRSLASAWHRWHSFAKEGAIIKRNAEALSAHVRERLLREHWALWEIAWVERCKLRTTVQRIAHGSAARAFLGWRVRIKPLYSVDINVDE